MISRTVWFYKHKDELHDSWMCGFDENNNEITDDSYHDFEDRMWREFEESQVDGSID
jgi:hypothetical protein